MELYKDGIMVARFFDEEVAKNCAYLLEVMEKLKRENDYYNGSEYELKS